MVSAETLKTALLCAVPLWIEELRQRSWDDLCVIARESAQVIAEKGDIIMFRSPKKGESGKAFNALARGLACLAFAPGGVKFLGLHWEAKHGQE